MRETKDSGIEAIGAIPCSWKISKVKSLFSFGKGLPITKANLLENGVPVISYGQIHAKDNLGTTISENLIRYVSGEYLENYSSSLVQKGDFIFADTSEDLNGCGNCVYVDQDMQLFAGYHTVILRAKENRDNRYLSYLFQTDAWRMQIRKQCTGVKLFSITNTILRDAVILIPEIEEQTRISDYLDLKCNQIDTLIAAKEKSNALLKERRQSIIYEAVTKGLNPDVPMKDSGVEWIGKIPATWRTLRLRFLGKFQNGISKAGDLFGSGYPFVSYSDVYKNEIIPALPSGLVQSTDAERALYSVEKGDIFFTRTSETKEEIGITAVCTETIPDATFAGFLIRMRPTTEMVSTEYLRYYFSCGLQREYFAKEMTLVTRASLGQDLLKNMVVTIPPKDEQTNIVEFLSMQTEMIDLLLSQNELAINKLKEYRQSVIYEAVTGKIEL